MSIPAKLSTEGGKGAITRGRFLSMGAATAVAAACGDPPGEPPPPPNRPPRPQAQRARYTTDQLRWAIPSYHLNTLFGEILPRYAAGVWHPADRYAAWEWPGENMVEPDLIEWIETRLLNEPQLSPGFQSRAENLVEYLKIQPLDSMTPRVIPVFWVADGGHDMLLSSDGLDLFVPPDPTVEQGSPEETDWQSRNALLWYYGFRRTGRAPIGLPTVAVPDDGVSTDFHPLHMIEAPTGASMISLPTEKLTLRALIEMVPGMVGRREGGLLCIEGVDAVVDRELERWSRDDVTAADAETMLVEVLGMDRDQFRAQGSEPGVGILLGRGERQQAVEQARDWVSTSRDSSDCVPLTMELFACQQGFHRAWQLPGAVYRAMLEAYPRIVAESWSRRLDRCPETAWTVDWKDALAKRLETDLPAEMSLGDQLDGIPTDTDGRPTGFEDIWKPNHIMISNLGIHLPDRTMPPSYRRMLREIVRGHAGNPVFTDSSQTG